MEKSSIKNYLRPGSAFYRRARRRAWSPSTNRNGKEYRGLIPNPLSTAPQFLSPYHVHHLRRPASSLAGVLEERAADLYYLGSTCQVAGPCPNVRVVPSFTKRAGSTTLVREQLLVARSHHRGREVERGSSFESGQQRLARPPHSPRGLNPHGITRSKEQGPNAAGRERDLGGREGRRGGAPRRGVAGAQREGAGRRGCCSALAALGARLCGARCTWARAGTWNGAPIPEQPPR